MAITTNYFLQNFIHFENSKFKSFSEFFFTSNQQSYFDQQIN